MSSSQLTIASILISATSLVSAQAQSPGWSNVTPGPTPRIGVAAVYDSTRSRTILFGGYDGQTRSDTWEWDGTTWTLRATTGPPGRYFHAMTYDPVRDRIVMFGGYYSTGASYGFLGDTWEWDGNSWNERLSSGPTARSGHAMAFDTSHGRTLLFGGSYFGGSAQFYGDTWSWDGTSWTPSTPFARDSCSSVDITAQYSGIPGSGTAHRGCSDQPSAPRRGTAIHSHFTLNMAGYSSMGDKTTMAHNTLEIPGSGMEAHGLSTRPTASPADRHTDWYMTQYDLGWLYSEVGIAIRRLATLWN